jgi:hypothetical protein
MSLDNTIEFLKANELKSVKEIYLMHLSSRNANAKQMKNAVVKEFGKPVFICGMADHVVEFGLETGLDNLKCRSHKNKKLIKELENAARSQSAIKTK